MGAVQLTQKNFENQVMDQRVQKVVPREFEKQFLQSTIKKASKENNRKWEGGGHTIASGTKFNSKTFLLIAALLAWKRTTKNSTSFSRTIPAAGLSVDSGEGC